MKCYSAIGLLMSLFITQIACNSSDKSQDSGKSNLPHHDSINRVEKKSQSMTIDSLNKSKFTPANTSGNFSKGKGSEKKISTEKPNRNRVLQDLTHPLQPPFEFVDETTDPAFHYSNSDGCETILTDTIQ